MYDKQWVGGHPFTPRRQSGRRNPIGALATAGALLLLGPAAAHPAHDAGSAGSRGAWSPKDADGLCSDEDADKRTCLKTDEDDDGTQQDAGAQQDETDDDARDSGRDDAADAYKSKQFLRAWRLAGDAYPQLSGIDSPHISLISGWRSRSAQSDSGAASGFSSLASMSMSGEEDRYGLQIITLVLHAPTPQRTSTRSFSSISRFSGAEPSFFWRRDDDLAPFLEIGTTPLFGEIAPTIQGKAGLAAAITDTISATLELDRTPVTDSIASHTGIIDAKTGEAFGRVVESGPKVTFDSSLSPRWFASVNASIGNLSGRNVLDNTHEAAEATIVYDLKLPAFDHFTVGPIYDYAHYDRNEQSLEISGNGGYYSPQELHRVGISVDFLTAEAGSFIVSGTLTPAWQYARQAGEPSKYGGDISADLAAAVRLTDHLSIGGFLHGETSSEYTDFAVGIGLKLSFSARSSVLSTDLPKTPFE